MYCSVILLLAVVAISSAKICEVPTGGRIVYAKPHQVGDVVKLLSGQAAAVNDNQKLMPGDGTTIVVVVVYKRCVDFFFVRRAAFG
jgi:hypothetical protein